jgi:hypothetical protein
VPGGLLRNKVVQARVRSEWFEAGVAFCVVCDSVLFASADVRPACDESHRESLLCQL